MDEKLIKACNILFNRVNNQKEEYHTKITDFYKLIISLSAVMLSLVATLHTKTDSITPCSLIILQSTILLLLLNVIFGVTALYGRAQAHLDIVNKILQTVDDQGPEDAYDSLYVGKNAVISQNKIYSLAHHFCIGGFLLSMVLIAWYALSNIK